MARKEKKAQQATPVVAAPAPSLPEPSEAERKAIAIAREKHNARSARVESGMQVEGNGLMMSNPHADGAGWQIRLQNAMGTRSHHFLDGEIRRIANVLQKDGKVEPNELDAVLAVLDGAEPQNEIEAMLVIQMAVTHILTMRSARLMAKSNEIPQQDSNGLALHRLTRTFTSQIDALAKLRRGGEQKVTVEHVHVYPGGQAIVGNVTHSPGTGVILENAEQPHAANDPRALALASGATVLCQDTQREALPVPDRPRQEALPDARRGAGVWSPEGRAERHVPPRLLHGGGNGRTSERPKMDA
jgi:hypothetical protein